MITSFNDLVSKAAAGQKLKMPFNRTIVTGATSVAGRWHEAMSGLGSGGSMVLTGTPGLGAALNAATAGALPQRNPTVTPDIKHAVTALLSTPGATVVPALNYFVDMLYIYPSCVVTGTPTTISNAAGKHARHNNGIDVQLGAIVATALGAATPTLTCSYTDSDGNAGNSTTLAASANSLPLGSLMTSAVAGSLGGPFANLAAGDKGVRQLDSYTLASGTTGTVTFFLYRILTDLPLGAVNTPSERDLVTQMFSMPDMADDMCLGLISQVGGALTTNNVLTGSLGAVWG